MPGILRIKARSGRTHKPQGEMNGLERRYAEHLQCRKLAGEIADFWFAKIKLKLAKICYLTVDFAVLMADGTIEFHECKGFLEDDAAVKVKVAAQEFWWFKFVLVKARAKKHGGGFEIAELGEMA